MSQKQQIRKTIRVSEEINRKIQKLRDLYKASSDNQLFIMMVEDCFQQKTSMALIPFEELNKREEELKRAILEIGKLQGIVMEKERQVRELKYRLESLESKRGRKKGFWSIFFPSSR